MHCNCAVILGSGVAIRRSKNATKKGQTLSAIVEIANYAHMIIRLNHFSVQII